MKQTDVREAKLTEEMLDRASRVASTATAESEEAVAEKKNEEVHKETDEIRKFLASLGGMSSESTV